MTNHTHATDQQDDIENWIAALKGEALDPGATGLSESQATLLEQEAMLMRRLIQGRCGASAELTQEREWEDFLGKLRRSMAEAEVKAAARPGSTVPPQGASRIFAGGWLNRVKNITAQWFATHRMRYALTAVIGLLAVSIGLSLYHDPASLSGGEDATETVWRGSEETQILRASNPLARADDIERILTRHGILVRRVAGEGTILLQARVPMEDEWLVGELRERLVPLGVKLPQHGRVDIRVTH